MLPLLKRGSLMRNTETETLHDNTRPTHQHNNTRHQHDNTRWQEGSEYRDNEGRERGRGAKPVPAGQPKKS